MENASKALLIAASVLVVIIIVAVGMKIYNSPKEVAQQAEDVGEGISSATDKAVEKFETAIKGDEDISGGDKNTNEPKEYNINVELLKCSTYASNPTTIKENETVTLKFETTVEQSLIMYWEYNITGAEYSVVENLNMATITLTNPKSNVNIKISVAAQKDPGCCFVAGTQVWTQDGETKNIENVVVGDEVLSYNEGTKEYEYKTVTALITNPRTTNLARVNLKDGTSIEMNEYHPIYTKEGWKSLTNYKGMPTLTEKDSVLTSDGEFMEISSIEQWVEKTPITTYNLSVEDNHNYFVGKTGILVHNADCPI